MSAGRRATTVPPIRDWRTVPPILDTEGIQVFLSCGRTHLEALMAAGMPFIDLGLGAAAGKHPGRTRRMLRFEPAVVLTWLRNRHRGAAA